MNKRKKERKKERKKMKVWDIKKKDKYNSQIHKDRTKRIQRENGRKEVLERKGE